VKRIEKLEKAFANFTRTTACVDAVFELACLKYCINSLEATDIFKRLADLEPGINQDLVFAKIAAIGALREVNQEHRQSDGLVKIEASQLRDSATRTIEGKLRELGSLGSGFGTASDSTSYSTLLGSCWYFSELGVCEINGEPMQAIRDRASSIFRKFMLDG